MPDHSEGFESYYKILAPYRKERLEALNRVAWNVKNHELPSLGVCGAASLRPNRN